MAIEIHRLVAFGLALLPALCTAQERGAAPSSLADIQSFLDDQVVAIARLDIRKVDVKAAIDFFARDVPADVAPPQQLAEGVTKGTEIRDGILKARFAEAYLIVSLADLPQDGPFVVLPHGQDAKPEQLQALLTELNLQAQSRDIRGALVIGSEATLERLGKIEGMARPDLAKALAATGDAAIQLAVSPTDNIRRGVRESLPALPPALGGLSGSELSDCFSWLAAGMNLPPKPSLHVTLQAKDAQSAEKLRSLAAAGLDLQVKNEQVQREFPPIKGLAPLMLPKAEGDQLVLKIDEAEGNVTKVVDELIKPAVTAARISATRAATANNLKQLMLGMHVYHDLFAKFPAQASMNKDGKKLLSWRVHLLPYLEQKELYDQFHLDEPWDSEHNKKLIEKMPPVFASPSVKLEAKEGKTPYVVPVGPKTVFEGKEGTGLVRISDGTSNTIAIVEVAPENAVVWTKPDDWIVDFSQPFGGLFAKKKDEPRPTGFHAAFCDGSVRFIASAIDWDMMRRLLQKDDGEPIGEF